MNPFLEIKQHASMICDLFFQQLPFNHKSLTGKCGQSVQPWEKWKMKRLPLSIYRVWFFCIIVYYRTPCYYRRSGNSTKFFQFGKRLWLVYIWFTYFPITTLPPNSGSPPRGYNEPGSAEILGCLTSYWCSAIHVWISEHGFIAVLSSPKGYCF